jgi:hypothetical protein
MDLKKRENIFFISVILISAVAIFLFNFQGIGDSKTTGLITGNVVSETWCQGADINRDGKVNSTDSNILNTYYGRSTASCDPELEEYCFRSDLNQDETVNSADLSILNLNYGRTDCTEITSTCEDSGYTCGLSTASGPEASCQLIGGTYLGNTDLDATCGEDKGCCSTPTFPTNPRCGLAQTSQLSFATTQGVISKGRCSIGTASSVYLSASLEDKWAWTCTNEGITINCNADKDLRSGELWCHGSDVNRDGKVDIGDYSVYSTNYERTDCNSQNLWCNHADINMDSTVDFFDLDLYYQSAGRTDCTGITTTCIETNPSYQCKLLGAGSEEEACGLTMEYVSNLVCNTNYVCCKPKTTSPTTTCESLDYTCGQTTASGPEVSCQLIGRNYLGNTDLDATCGSSKGCCSTLISPTTPQCGSSHGTSVATADQITSKCSPGTASAITFSQASNKWIWTCSISGVSVNCNASYVAPTTLCSQQGNVCGNINTALNKTLSCSAIKMQWANNSALDTSCNSTGNQGCCIPCTFEFNSTGNVCYPSRQRCSTLGGDICDEETETCSTNYFNSLDARCCPQTCVAKSRITYTPTSRNLRDGYDAELRKGKDKIEFEVDDEEHTLEITEVTKTTATIKISSETITSTLSIDDIRKYDLDKNGNYDIKVELEDIDDDDKIAYITLYTINEKVTSTTQGQQQQSDYKAVNTQALELETSEEDSGSSWFYLVFLIIILIVFVGVLLYLAYRKNH